MRTRAIEQARKKYVEALKTGKLKLVDFLREIDEVLGFKVKCKRRGE